jgi:hypothetical protein
MTAVYSRCKASTMANSAFSPVLWKFVVRFGRTLAVATAGRNLVVTPVPAMAAFRWKCRG